MKNWKKWKIGCLSFLPERKRNPKDVEERLEAIESALLELMGVDVDG